MVLGTKQEEISGRRSDLSVRTEGSRVNGGMLMTSQEVVSDSGGSWADFRGLGICGL